MSAAEPLPERLVELVGRAGEGEQPLCELDEAQLLAVGWTPPGRPSGPPFAGLSSPNDFPGLDQSRQRLLAAGLAEPGMTDLPVPLTAAGALRDYLTLVARDRLHTATWFQRLQAGAPGPWLVRRLTPLRSAPVVVLERMGRTASAGPAPDARPVPVEICLAPLDAVIDELVELAYRGPVNDAERQAAPGTEAVHLGPDRRAADVPSRLVHDWDRATATLHWRTLSLFGRRTGRDWLGRAGFTAPDEKPAQYHAHLRRRLAVPEPLAP